MRGQSHEALGSVAPTIQLAQLGLGRRRWHVNERRRKNSAGERGRNRNEVKPAQAPTSSRERSDDFGGVRVLERSISPQIVGTHRVMGRGGSDGARTTRPRNANDIDRTLKQ